MIFVSHSAAETYSIAKNFGLQLSPNSILCFYGDLGAGKTTFIKGLAAGILGTEGNEVNSPTFTYLNIYRGPIPLYHFDLYRLKDADEFIGMGFDEVFGTGGICCIEWAEKISVLGIPGIIEIQIDHIDQETRKIIISP